MIFFIFCRFIGTMDDISCVTLFIMMIALAVFASSSPALGKYMHECFQASADYASKQ